MTLSRRSFLSAAASVAGAGAIAPAMSSIALAAAPKIGAQVPGIYRFSVGDIEVTAILDGHLGLDPSLVVGFDQKVAEETLKQNFRSPNTGDMSISVNGYLINTGEHLIVVDTGTADLMGPTLGRFHQNLKNAGYNAADVDAVVLTHLHIDHIGGVVSKSGEKLFPNAEFVVHEIEHTFWNDENTRARFPKDLQNFVDLAQKASKPYDNNKTLISKDGEFIKGLDAVLLPGHTPGHMGIRIHSNNEEVLIWGDTIHSSALQFANPDWTIAFDIDQDMARKTRRTILDRVSTDRTPVIGIHHDFPGLGHVRRVGDAFAYVETSWQHKL
ncbi:MBL fold metallo-hydrolase [Pseudovibrio brasiliensis]|uniref:MBL fold metallo-hydrolase n=1 Tax=Pseudovibrio brasiliensis TaxID=1898042 RepID=A0ABX8ALX8_9HYPH|nr:MBL fold metallo-hydrolase [Pseudovibrio brasiliensis]QUS55677.1 MBL fold metallo-hydrolase [Pseudovibrio brasiliensis]